MGSMRLRIEPVDGSTINDYRIEGGRLEVRTLDSSGQPSLGANSDWRPLDPTDIELHRALDTIVAKWLEVRLEATKAEK